MQIKNMFRDDINREINGVVQVEQNNEEVVLQEVKEYVVTSELKKHLAKFFSEYAKSFTRPTDNTGVWITGFFGSGKSHFLKMLSYILDNKIIGGKNTVDYFEEKFDDQLSFMDIRTSTQVPTETILFNIDDVGSINKDDTAILKVFTKMFYNHLGFYGNELKIVKLEQHLTKQGKYDEFKKGYEAINGDSWVNSRSEFAFFEDDIVETLIKVLNISETTARNWMNSSQDVEFSIEELVDDINSYVKSKGKDFRLLFMIDEAGQYIGTNTSMLLNLQTLIERLGSVCRGQVWVVATGQEALDEMIKVRQDEFSRIMARFNVRLSLTSSSVGEVIEKRLLTKTEEAKDRLEAQYDNNTNVLNNLYAFETEVKDIKGYKSKDEFVRIYPFVPYQFIIMQKIFNEIRKHGHAGKHQSHGERSMLNGFQESAQIVQYRDENTLVPLYEFYDTLHSFLDNSVREVIERADRAANDNNGLNKEDVNLLKLLYLIRYVDDIPSNIENLTILMADSISVDKLELKEQVKKSLDKLMKQNYISRNGDLYQFLTNEEQEIEREIFNTNVDMSSVTSEICKSIFDKIYAYNKYTVGKSNFEFVKTVDNTNHGNARGDIKLRFVTPAFEDRDDLGLIGLSKGDEAICKLSEEYDYFSNYQDALKINKYVAQKNVPQLPESKQLIISMKQREARRLKDEAEENLIKAIVNGEYYIDGQKHDLKGTSPKLIIDNALQLLVERTYQHLSEIGCEYSDDTDIKNILNGLNNVMPDVDPNNKAYDSIIEYLYTQKNLRLDTTMADIQSRFQGKGYGWRDIDIAASVARLVVSQKVNIKYAGEVLKANDYRLINCLRNKNDIGKATILIRENVDASKINRVKQFVRDYFGGLNLPDDEDGLLNVVAQQFSNELTELNTKKSQSQNKALPGLRQIEDKIKLINNVLNARRDNFAFVKELLDSEDELLNSLDDMKDVDNFYKNQLNLFNSALELKHKVEVDEKDYLMHISEIAEAVESIKQVTNIGNNFNFGRVRLLNDYISIINQKRDEVVQEKRSELIALIDQCEQEVILAASDNSKIADKVNSAKAEFTRMTNEVNNIKSLVTLDAKKNAIVSRKDVIKREITNALNTTPADIPKQPAKNIKKARVYRNVIFDQSELSNEAEIDAYLSKMKAKLLKYLNDNDKVSIE